MKYILIAFGCVAGFVVMSLIVLAVALPKLTSAQRYAQESATIKSISTLNTAETQYFSQFGHFASTLEQLGPPAGGTPGPDGADLIDSTLAGGTKNGFRFELQLTPSGYSVRAAPVNFGTSGTHTYYCDQTMAIRQHAGSEPASENDPAMGQP